MGSTCGLDSWSLSPTLFSVLCFLHQCTGAEDPSALSALRSTYEVLRKTINIIHITVVHLSPVSIHLLAFCPSAGAVRTPCICAASQHHLVTSSQCSFCAFFFQAASHFLLYHTCGTSHARVLSCTLLLQMGLDWVLSASSLGFGVICLSFACYILLLRAGTSIICVLQGSDYWLGQNFLNQNHLP